MRIGFIVALFTILVAQPVRAAEISMPLTDDEQRAFRAILDLATKAGGLSVAQATVHFAVKLETLQQQNKQVSPNGN
jgi:hypothetical protein